ncbi:hypothetical protein G5I_11646 [Acromyrmex echinatior]|uniref:Uncharacterized protein n=1 Tax=Acromyrmex echinatior TaxID=103372 RepID=F4X058_ACREC|nr:hypothetical protein G5I_11646 [Acromyrmex echinatior]
MMNMVSVKGSGPKIVSDVCLPRELRLRVVNKDIVNSPVTAVETSNALMVIDSSEGRARAKSLSKMNTSRMDDYDDDVLDRPDFLQIIKKDWQTDKKKKLQECPLDDSLSYKQKTAVDEITYLFPQMSPTIMTETLREEVARQAVQQLAANSARAQEPIEVMSGKCLQLEREVASLKRQMEIIQKDRDSLRKEVRLLRRELVSCKASGCRKLDYGEEDRQVAGTSHISPLDRRVASVTEDIPPARRPSLRGVSRAIPKDSSVRRKLVDERGHIILSAAVNGQEDNHQREKDLAGFLLQPKLILFPPSTTLSWCKGSPRASPGSWLPSARAGGGYRYDCSGPTMLCTDLSVIRRNLYTGFCTSRDFLSHEMPLEDPFFGMDFQYADRGWWP